jgi:hypothetical protein
VRGLWELGPRNGPEQSLALKSLLSVIAGMLVGDIERLSHGHRGPSFDLWCRW